MITLVAITAIYLVLGGYSAVTVTSFIQGIIMLIGAAIMLGVLIFKAGGLSEAVRSVSANYEMHVPVEQRPSWLTVASLIFMTSVGSWGLPQMVQKFYAIKNEKVIPKAAIITTIFSLVIGVTAYGSGILSHVFMDLDTVPRMANGGINYDQIMPNLLAAKLPEVLLAVIMLLILSASMSSLASLVLVSASSISVDLYKGYLHRDISEKNSVILMRVFSVIFIIATYLISKLQIGFIVTLQSLSWGVLSGAFLAPYMFGIYSKKVTKAGAYAGIYAGAGSGIILTMALGAANSALAASIAIIVPFFVVPVVSAFTPKVSKETLDKAFA